MDQQSEHLTNAQIETYGDRNTGAGPSGPGDNTDQAIDAHLAGCAGCRTRLLEFHRSRLGLMKDRSQAPAPHPDDPTAAPTSSAQRTVTQTIAGQATVSQPAGQGTPNCPPEDALRDLAAGLTPEADAARLAQHAAQCDHCGPILRAYTEDFCDDLSPEDAALLAQLNSASPTWQKKLAEQMAAAVGSVAQPGSPDSPVLADRGGLPPSAVFDRTSVADNPSATQAPALDKTDTKPSFFRLPSLKWLVPIAAAACAVIGFFIWNSQRDTPEKVEKLLAQAYTEQRTMEMRIPYAAHADFKQTRSGDSASRLSLPPALNGATDAISKQLVRNPDDPKWLMLSARVDLMDWNYKPALSTLEKITDPQIIDSPEFLLTRSLALYEKSEVTKSTQGYFEAVDLLARALQKTPNDPVLLFNQAVACEKIYSYECAANDWDRFLQVEKDPNWIAEARKQLDQTNEKKNLAR